MLAPALTLAACSDELGSADRMNALERRLADLEKRASAQRYQIVNPTPEYIRNTMLLDTATGRTWIYCTLTDATGKTIEGTKANSWCDMS